ncbi:transcription cofactor vestigial-like protein 3 [Mixophyes fleayi]|uniref:transcription cofactor vestigial-like protein 3 n=1 Tax=Mixophyes fleayi TaxID=3061075 RepID=UPI003F4DEC46
MSCLDVMYHHQVYGMHQYLPGTSACSTAYYHHHNQQKKIAAYNKMQEALEEAFPGKQEEDEKDQPAEMEYLNSRCVLLTYFHGDIEAVVDEHFSRALSQISTFNPDNTATKSKIETNRENSSVSCQRTSLPPSLWANSYQSPTPACLSGVHQDFPASTTGTFSTTDHSSWPGDNVHQTVSHPPPVVSEPWPYPLASPTSSPYAHMHDVYMYHHHAHPHMHHHHHHHHRHPSPHLDPRYGPLLMPSVRTARIPAPHCDVIKTEATTTTMGSTAWAGAFHGTVDIVPSFGFETGNSFSA